MMSELHQMQVNKVDQKYYEEVSKDQLKILNEVNANFDASRS